MKVIKNPGFAIKLTKQEAIDLGISPTEVKQNGEMKTFGHWQIPVSYKALCISNKYDKSKVYTQIEETVLYGLRTMSRPKQSGYCLEGYVSIKGKKYSSYTSRITFEVDGLSIDVSTINARL